MVRRTQKGERDNAHRQNTRKVLFIASVYTHLAAFHIPFMKLLQEKGYDLYAAASSAEGRKEDVEAAGVTCWEIPFARSPYSPANIQAFRRLRALLKAHHFDLIHVHTPVAAFMGRYLAKATGQGPVLYTAHGFHFYRGAPLKNWLIYYTAERIAARWTDGLIVMNDEDFENARRLGFQPEKNLFYVHGVGVDLTRYSPSPGAGSIKAELGLRRNDPIVTCVAELNANKNHVFLLDAWQSLSPRCGSAHLLLVGTGEKVVELRRKVEQEQIPRVHFLGYRKDVPQILQETDILTLVSKREGLPKCIMEAMASGKPVVATNVRGSRDLVDHGKTGLLVELGDVNGLAAALENLITSPDLRADMGRVGLEKIKDYSLEKVLKEMNAIYGRYLGK
ncbi:MAG: glycosyltransferase family 4 protein [Bacillota bacterium]